MRLTRRAVVGGLASLSVATATTIAPAQSLPRGLTIVGVSWIDRDNLPNLSTFAGFAAAVMDYWPFRVMVGLVATSNPRPATALPESFLDAQQHRAYSSFSVSGTGAVSNSVIDGGYTPGIDLTRTPGFAPNFLFRGYDATHPGETSALSGTVTGRLHPASSLRVEPNETVISSTLVKFRAGKETDEIGINTANSPHHVPWVWHEHALIRTPRDTVLRMNGSRFPSHAWYIDRRRVALRLQAPVKMSDTEPALITGPRKGSTVIAAASDTATGPIGDHPFTVAAHPLGSQEYRIIF